MSIQFKGIEGLIGKNAERLALLSKIAPIRNLRTYEITYNALDGPFTQTPVRVYRSSKPTLVTFEPVIDVDPNIALPQWQLMYLSMSSSNLNNNNSFVLVRHLYNSRTFIIPAGQSWHAAALNSTGFLTVIEHSLDIDL